MVEPLLFDLRFRKECYEVQRGGKLIRLEARDAKVADAPSWFKPLRGNHGPVARQAEHYNRLQTRSGFLDYFFFPEVAETVAT